MTPDSRMRLVLSGGGSARDARPLDEIFAAWVGMHGTLLYLPFALTDDDPLLRTCEVWIHSVFDPLGVSQIETWQADHLEAMGTDWDRRLSAVDGVYIGGGNTFRLLHLLQHVGLDGAIVRYTRRGGPVSGGSAGAVVLGHDIKIAELVGDVDRNGPMDTRALNLLDDHADVLPHYEASLDGRIREHVRRTRRPVLALPERSGVIVSGNHRRDGGHEPSRTFPQGG